MVNDGARVVKIVLASVTPHDLSESGEPLGAIGVLPQSLHEVIP
jgi:hypothetical protein